MMESLSELKSFRDEFCQDGSAVIDRRNGCCGVLIDGKFYIWGGQTEDIIDGEREAQDLPRDDDSPCSFDVFDMTTYSWTRQETHGTDIPLEQGLGSSLIHDLIRNKIYLFGGSKGHQFDSNIYSLSLEDFYWEIIEPVSGNKPSPRYNSEVFLHNGKLYMFGGVATVSNVILDPGARWISAAPDGNYGWTNEYLTFDLKTKIWEVVLHDEDDRPPPLGGHRIAKYNQDMAVLFGGKGPPNATHPDGRSNQAWILNLATNQWKGPYGPKSDNELWPKAVRFFTFTPLLDPNKLEPADVDTVQQKILLLWGKAIYSNIRVEDCHRSTWIMEIVNGDSIVWTELAIKEKPRAWHVAAVYHPFSSKCSVNCEVIVFGGNKHIAGDTGPRNAVSDTCIIEFGNYNYDHMFLSMFIYLGVYSLQKMCLNVMTERGLFLTDFFSSVPPKFQKLIQNFLTVKKHHSTVNIVRAEYIKS